MGQTSIADGTNYLQAIVAEAIGTFLLVTAIMALAVDKRAPGGWAGLMIGLSVAAAILLIGPLTGGSLNPARTFGPLVVAHDRRRGHLLGRPARVSDRAADRRRCRSCGLRRRRAAARIRRSETAQGTQGDIEGQRDRMAELAAEPASQETAGDITGRRS